MKLRQDPYGLNYGDDSYPDDPSWFPVFKLFYDDAFYVVILGDKGKSPVRNYDPEYENYNICYESLTNLLLHSADWFESAQYHEDMESWKVDTEIDSKLKVKYRVVESINK